MSAAATYRNLRYAEASRFEPSHSIGMSTLDPNRGRGPLPPQNPSRLEMVLGPQTPLEQSEDCLVLSVSTPDLSGSRPVLVWFHGGANVTGGGELPWYDGAVLAQEQDMVVVVVTARLGLLGFLRLDGGAGPSLATGDQLNALAWIGRHIENFGGDPSKITVGGQSAGATAVDAMLQWGVPDGVCGAILQSGYRLGEPMSADDAFARTLHFLDFADRDPRELSMAQLLELQRGFTTVSPEIWRPVRPETSRPLDIPVIAGWTRDDGLPFVMLAEGVSDPSVRTQPSVADASRTLTEAWFAEGSKRVVSEAKTSGHGGWLYEFVQQHPSSNWGAPHCAELPYLLGNKEAWLAAPMLRGADWEGLRRRSGDIRRELANFIRDQDPGDRWTSVVWTPFGLVNRCFFEE